MGKPVGKRGLESTPLRRQPLGSEPGKGSWGGLLGSNSSEGKCIICARKYKLPGVACSKNIEIQEQGHRGDNRGTSGTIS